MKRLFLLMSMLVVLSNCVFAQEQTASTAEKVTFPMVAVPEDITEPQARAKYLGEHFWDKVDFGTASEALIEQGLIDMASIFPLLDGEVLASSMTNVPRHRRVHCSEYWRWPISIFMEPILRYIMSLHIVACCNQHWCQRH